MRFSAAEKLAHLVAYDQARVLGEFGDAPKRYAAAKARKNHAGISPITRASGKKKVVLARVFADIAVVRGRVGEAGRSC